MAELTVSDRLERQARDIVQSLKGRWSRGRGMCCCPAHEDRTPSLSVTLGSRAILFHCFAGCPNADVIKALGALGISTGKLFSASRGLPAPVVRDECLSENVQRLWRASRCLAGSPAEKYLAKRAIHAASPDLRYLERTPLGPKESVRFVPAMIAAVRSDLGVVALHRTFLDARSGRIAAFDGPKRALGALGRGAVRLWAPRGGRLGLAEGIETALSVQQLFGIPCWATLGTERFGAVAVPEAVGELHLFLDNDTAGAIAERRARKAHTRDGRRILSHRPEQPGCDYNDVLMADIPTGP